MDPNYEPSEMESRTLYGMQLEQKRNNAVIDKSFFTNVVSNNKEVYTSNVTPFILWLVLLVTLFFLTEENGQNPTIIVDRNGEGC